MWHANKRLNLYWLCFRLERLSMLITYNTVISITIINEASSRLPPLYDTFEHQTVPLACACERVVRSLAINRATLHGSLQAGLPGNHTGHTRYCLFKEVSEPEE